MPSKKHSKRAVVQQKKEREADAPPPEAGATYGDDGECLYCNKSMLMAPADSLRYVVCKPPGEHRVAVHLSCFQQAVKTYQRQRGQKADINWVVCPVPGCTRWTAVKASYDVEFPESTWALYREKKEEEERRRLEAAEAAKTRAAEAAEQVAASAAAAHAGPAASAAPSVPLCTYVKGDGTACGRKAANLELSACRIHVDAARRRMAAQKMVEQSPHTNASASLTSSISRGAAHTKPSQLGQLDSLLSAVSHSAPDSAAQREREAQAKAAAQAEAEAAAAARAQKAEEEREARVEAERTLAAERAARAEAAKAEARASMLKPATPQAKGKLTPKREPEPSPTWAGTVRDSRDESIGSAGGESKAASTGHGGAPGPQSSKKGVAPPGFQPRWTAPGAGAGSSSSPATSAASSVATSAGVPVNSPIAAPQAPPPGMQRATSPPQAPPGVGAVGPGPSSNGGRLADGSTGSVGGAFAPERSPGGLLGGGLFGAIGGAPLDTAPSAGGGGGDMFGLAGAGLGGTLGGGDSGGRSRFAFGSDGDVKPSPIAAGGNGNGNGIGNDSTNGGGRSRGSTGGDDDSSFLLFGGTGIWGGGSATPPTHLPTAESAPSTIGSVGSSALSAPSAPSSWRSVPGLESPQFSGAMREIDDLLERWRSRLHDLASSGRDDDALAWVKRAVADESGRSADAHADAERAIAAAKDAVMKREAAVRRAESLVLARSRELDAREQQLGLIGNLGGPGGLSSGGGSGGGMHGLMGMGGMHGHDGLGAPPPVGRSLSHGAPGPRSEGMGVSMGSAQHFTSYSGGGIGGGGGTVYY